MFYYNEVLVSEGICRLQCESLYMSSSPFTLPLILFIVLQGNSQSQSRTKSNQWEASLVVISIRCLRAPNLYCWFDYCSSIRKNIDSGEWISYFIYKRYKITEPCSIFEQFVADNAQRSYWVSFSFLDEISKANIIRVGYVIFV